MGTDSLRKEIKLTLTAAFALVMFSSENGMNHTDKHSIHVEQVYHDEMLTVHETVEQDLITIIWSDTCGNILDPENKRAFDRMNCI